MISLGSGKDTVLEVPLQSGRKLLGRVGIPRNPSAAFWRLPSRGLVHRQTPRPWGLPDPCGSAWRNRICAKSWGARGVPAVPRPPSLQISAGCGAAAAHLGHCASPGLRAFRNQFVIASPVQGGGTDGIAFASNERNALSTDVNWFRYSV